MQLMQVNRLIRSAIRLVKGTELRQTADSFEIAVLSGILWFKASASPAYKKQTGNRKVCTFSHHNRSLYLQRQSG